MPLQIFESIEIKKKLMEEEFKSILERARNLSKQVSLRSLSVDELCIKLGINRSTLLKYSKTKRDLVESLLLYEYCQRR
ncbi:MAG: hypothetical protein CVU06_02510 [Bacteroidetes bacterium HGW-Bacteroidetes-22]|nr:MAG: hypothetical protein CVU06_02510 [Bacteroidetes bacterium HGW-Bacteroidetes-22]